MEASIVDLACSCCMTDSKIEALNSGLMEAVTWFLIVWSANLWEMSSRQRDLKVEILPRSTFNCNWLNAWAISELLGSNFSDGFKGTTVVWSGEGGISGMEGIQSLPSSGISGMNPDS
eukprot:TRINITY_DN2177_c0_g1_i5.p2 TRINITY_DN2177_c0_g1~~TRINITY_DN2177_c0_g1_i5.p2  ORF type:complete len:118 (+),score=18.38 TRINITY_DN2177_c0_g1_i5:580-933(+)